MTYVLIVIGYFGGYVGGTVITTQEFSSAQTCEAARAALVAEAKAWSVENKVRPFCVAR